MNAATSSTARPAPMTTRDLVEWIRERIRVGLFVPGQRLVEADILREVSSSRAKVREALQRLETEGLVTIEEFRGASVKKIGMDEVRQIYRARMALEGQAAADFAAGDEPALKARLLAVQEEMNSLEGTNDHARFGPLNAEWHSIIIEGARNDYIRDFLSRLSVPIHRLLFSAFYSAQRISIANSDHRRITDAIVGGRTDEAQQLMRDHITQGLEALSELNSHFYA